MQLPHLTIFRESDKIKTDHKIQFFGGEPVEYAKSDLPVCFSVRSVTTVLKVDFSGFTLPDSGDSHGFCEINYVERGTFCIRVDGVAHTLTEGQMIIYAPNSFHVLHRGCDAFSNIISFEAEWSGFESLFNRPITLTPRQRQTVIQLVDSGREMFRPAKIEDGLKGMLVRDGADALELQKLKNQLELFIIDVFKTDKVGLTAKQIGAKEQFDRAVAYMTENISKNISLEDVAHHCTVSVSRLKVVFKEISNDSPISHFIELKLEKAKCMMTETSKNFTQISDELGFASVHYFSKIFKKKTGMSPTEYVKSMGKN